MDQTLDLWVIHKAGERTKLGKANHAALTALPYLRRFHQLGTALGTLFLRGGALGEDQAVATAIHFNHLDRDVFTNHAAPTLVGGVASGAAAALTANLGS